MGGILSMFNGLTCSKAPLMYKVHCYFVPFLEEQILNFKFLFYYNLSFHKKMDRAFVLEYDNLCSDKIVLIVVLFFNNRAEKRRRKWMSRGTDRIFIKSTPVECFFSLFSSLFLCAFLGIFFKFKFFSFQPREMIAGINIIKRIQCETK